MDTSQLANKDHTVSGQFSTQHKAGFTAAVGYEFSYSFS